MPKLTRAQKDYLRLLNENPRFGLCSYRPACRLIELRLASRGRYRGMGYSEYAITPAGRLALEQEASQ